MNESKTINDRQLLTAAQQRGAFSTVLAFFRLSGPGWLQSAITLGGGSLIGALYLGMLGGTHMLWLQLVAIVIGVIMLSAISYVTLSTRKRPYAAINEYINPVLGVGWITATILANMIWILPQFSLCYDALDKNLVSGGLGDAVSTKAMISGAVAIAALIIVLLSFKRGWMSKFFDIVLKLMVGMIVICFVYAVYLLASQGQVIWNDVLMGFIPNLSNWNQPSPKIQELLAKVGGEQQTYWSNEIIARQRESMIGVTATAVGLNMTFLLPYSMLARGWDKPFRGLARFDLITGLAIPYLIVTTCIVIASSHAFHAKADADFVSNDPAVMQSSVLFDSTMGVLEKRLASESGPMAQRLSAINDELKGLTDEQQVKAKQAEKKQLIAEFGASLSKEEKQLAPTLVKPNAAQLAATLKPIFGNENSQRYADLIFGLGAFAMGFSTIIILMLINSYAFAEISGQYENNLVRIIGAIAAAVTGFCWFLIWAGGSKTWLGIVASTFGAILLPIAYIAFFALMNSRRVLGREKPVGTRMIVWNLLMGIGVLGAMAQAYGAIATKIKDPVAGPVVIGGAVTFGILALVGFSARRSSEDEEDYDHYFEDES